MRSKRSLILLSLAALLGLTLLLGVQAEGRQGAESGSEAPLDSSRCVFPKEYMHANHMKVLEAWKRDAAHEGPDAVEVTADGRRFTKNLSTCLACHATNSFFCFSCHMYTNVEPDCWDCHISPMESVE